VRGSQHSTTLWEFIITEKGVTITKPIRALTGVLTGAPVLGESYSMSDLSPRSRFVLSTLRSVGSASLPELASRTNLPAEQLAQDLTDLQQQGLVLVMQKNDMDFYKVTM
jgi:predicted transcriptional regulator